MDRKLRKLLFLSPLLIAASLLAQVGQTPISVTGQRVGSGTQGQNAIYTSANRAGGQDKVWADPRDSVSPAPSAGGDWCAGVNSLWAAGWHAIDGTNPGAWSSGGKVYCNSDPVAGAPSGAKLLLPCSDFVVSKTFAPGNGAVDVEPCQASSNHAANQNGTNFILCSDSTGITGCGPNAYPSFELTQLNKYPVGERHAPDLTCYSSGTSWGAHFCKAGSVLSTGTASFTLTGTSVTGSGVTWDSSMIGGYIVDCDFGTKPATCSSLGRIGAVPNSTTLTLQSAWRGNTSAGNSYTIWKSNVFVAYADGLTGALDRTIFGHTLGPVNFDLAGIANAVAYYNAGGCQENCTIRGLQIAHNNSNQTNVESNQAYACAVWDATFRPGGGQAHWEKGSPAGVCSTFNGGGSSSYGYLVDMYSIILSASIPGSGPASFKMGSVIGTSGHGVQVALSLDGILGANQIDCGHAEWTLGDMVEVGGTSGVSGIRISDCDVGSSLGGDVIHFLIPTNFTNQGNTVENVSSRLGNQPLIVDDANTSTNVTGKTYVGHWEETPSNAYLDNLKVFTSLDVSGAPVNTGLKFPSAAGAAPTADGQVASNTTTHLPAFGSNGATMTPAIGASNGRGSMLTCVAASASGTAYTCSTSPTFTPGTGDFVLFKADVASTASATLAVNGATAATIKLNGSATNLAANDLAAGEWSVATFDGTNWQLEKESAIAITGTSPITFSTARAISLGHSINAQSGAGYTLVSGDKGKLITVSNAAAQTINVPTPIVNVGYFVWVENIGTAPWTLGRNGFNIDGSTNQPILCPGQGLMIFSDGANYFTDRGMGGIGGWCSGDSNHSATVTTGSGTSIGSTSLCATAFCPAGTYRVNAYTDITTACATTGTYIVNLIYTDDQGSKTVPINIQGTGTTPTTGSLALNSTANFGQAAQIIRSTGSASINYSTTATLCGSGGPMVGKLYLSVEPVQ